MIKPCESLDGENRDASEREMLTMMKLLSQLEQVVIATPFARRLEVWISAAESNSVIQYSYSHHESEREDCLSPTHCPWNRRPSDSIRHDEDEEECDAHPSLSRMRTPVGGVFGYGA